MALFISSVSFAAYENPSCQDFQRIKNLRVKLSEGQIDKILPRAEWLDEEYRKQDYKQMGFEGAKTVFLIAINRLTVFSYIFTSGRAEAATRTGYFMRSPKNFAEFLELPTANACFYLSMNGSESEILRQLTHELWLVFESVI